MTTSFDAVRLPQIAENQNFHPTSKVWIYPSSRRLTDDETVFVKTQLLQFCKNWTAHNQALAASAEVFENRLVILAVDESQAGASGCSIDKSVHFLERLGESVGADFFDRMTFGWLDSASGEVKFGGTTALSEAVRSGEISANTLMLNTLAQNRAEVLEKFWLPFEQSWHRRLV